MNFSEKVYKKLSLLKDELLYRELFRCKGISFITNDYLGLSSHPEILKEISFSNLKSGSGGSRLLGGNSEFIEFAEEKIADFFGAPTSLIFGSGYLANLGVIYALSEFFELIISDESNHASLIDGIKLSNKPKRIIPHNQWKTAVLDKVPSLVICESLFSMDGDYVDWHSLENYLSKSESFLIIDEAHAGGIFPKSGKILSAFSKNWENLVSIVTFGKAFGVYGAAVLCSKTVKEWLINKARTFIYSTSLPPVIIAMILKSLEISEKESLRREKLWDISKKIRQKLFTEELLLPKDLTEPNCYSPIIPVIIGNEKKAIKVSEKMRNLGYEIRPIRYPTVKKGSERIRISLSFSNADFAENMLEELIKCLRSI